MARPDARHGGGSALAGIILMLLAVALFVAMDAVAKQLIREHHVVQVVWARLTSQFLIIALAIPKRGIGAFLRTRRPGLHLLRGLVMVGMITSFYVALIYIPLADAIAIVFAAPFFVVALAVPVLGERVGPRRWTAVAIGFLGALVIIRPGLGVVHWAAIMPLLSALGFAVVQLVTRELTRSESTLLTMFYSAGLGALVSSALVAPFWAPPTPLAWGLMIAMGALGGLGDLALIAAYRRAEASLLAPFAYSQLIWATAIGFLAFGDLPDRWTVAGALIIVAGGLYLAARERVLARGG